MFLPLFRYAYVKACKKGEITEEDFELSSISRDEEVYTLTEEGEEKVRKLVERIMNEQVYYLNTKMPLHKAMKECASFLCGFLLGDAPFFPFICVSDMETFKMVFKFFQKVETFCRYPKKGPPFSMLDILA